MPDMYVCFPVANDLHDHGDHRGVGLAGEEIAADGRVEAAKGVFGRADYAAPKGRRRVTAVRWAHPTVPTGPEQFHGFETWLTTEIYPADFF